MTVNSFSSFPPLTLGQTIGLVAPARWTDEKEVSAYTTYLEKKGYAVKVGSHVYGPSDRFVSASDSKRAADIMAFFQDPDVHALFTLHGGYGSMRFLDLLDYDLLRRNPKPFVGFSDTTSLQLALLARSGIPSYSGVTVRDVLQGIDPTTENSLWSLLAGRSFSVTGFNTVQHGVVTAPVVGGCLILLSTLLGTPYFPDLHGKILLIEEVSEQPYSIDRMLTHLYLAGVFHQVSAVVFGTFHQCLSQDQRDGTLEQVIDEWCSKIHVPCIKNFPYGHHKGRFVMPCGGMATLDTTQGTLLVHSLGK